MPAGGWTHALRHPTDNRGQKGACMRRTAREQLGACPRAVGRMPSGTRQTTAGRKVPACVEPPSGRKGDCSRAVRRITSDWPLHASNRPRAFDGCSRAVGRMPSGGCRGNRWRSRDYCRFSAVIIFQRHFWPGSNVPGLGRELERTGFFNKYFHFFFNAFIFQRHFRLHSNVPGLGRELERTGFF